MIGFPSMRYAELNFGARRRAAQWGLDKTVLES
jgi:hypothetical protein